MYVVKYSVIKETAPEKLCGNLEEEYMAKSMTDQWMLKWQMFRLHMEEGARFVNHLNVLNNLAT